MTVVASPATWAAAAAAAAAAPLSTAAAAAATAEAPPAPLLGNATGEGMACIVSCGSGVRIVGLSRSSSSGRSLTAARPPWIVEAERSVEALVSDPESELCSHRAELKEFELKAELELK